MHLHRRRISQASHGKACGSLTEQARSEDTGFRFMTSKRSVLNTPLPSTASIRCLVDSSNMCAKCVNVSLELSRTLCYEHVDASGCTRPLCALFALVRDLLPKELPWHMAVLLDTWLVLNTVSLSWCNNTFTPYSRELT